jgi:hypothetical protein
MKSAMKRLLPFAVMALLLCSFSPGAARADSTTAAMQRVAASFAKLHSFRATMQNSTLTSNLEYAAPDRYHMIIHASREMEETIIGDIVYAKIGTQWMKLPIPGVGQMIAGFRAPDTIAKRIDSAKIKDLGTTKLGDTWVHQYAIDYGDGTSTVMWIGPKDLPLRIDTQQTGKRKLATTILYSDYNAPITIDAPV